MMVLFSVAKSVLFSFTNEVKKPMTISTSLEEVYHQTVVFGESISPKSYRVSSNLISFSYL